MAVPARVSFSECGGKQMPYFGAVWKSSLAAACLTLLPGCVAAFLATLEPEQRASMFLVPADRAVIYFYREKSRMDPVPMTLALNGERIGEPGERGFLYREVVPGEYTVSLSGTDTDSVTLKVEAGRTYFVGEDVECVAASKHLYLHPVGEAAGRARVRALAAARKLQPEDVRVAEAPPQCGSAAGRT
jgi:hypothetical protein